MIQQGCDDALKGEANMSASLSQKGKVDMINKAKSVILMCLGDKALREVTKENSVAPMWVKLEYIVYDQILGTQTLSKATVALV